MKLVWGIYENEYQPRLFDAEKLKDKVTNVIVSEKSKDGRNKTAHIISTVFEMDSRQAVSLGNWYGGWNYPRIIGSFEYKEEMF